MSDPGPGQPGAAPPPRTWPAPGAPTPPASPPPAPPTPPPAPGWDLPTGPAPAPTPGRARNRHSHVWIWFLVGAVVLLLAGTIFGVVLGVDAFSKPVDATNQYYANVRAHRYHAAYNQRCRSTQRNLTLNEFIAQQRQNDLSSGPLRSYDFFVGVVAGDTGRAIGTEHRRNDRDVTVHLAKEGTVWRVCGINTR